MYECNTFWGSHGCNLPAGHDPDEAHPIHQCEYPDFEGGDVWLCSQAQWTSPESTQVRHETGDGWSEWEDYGLPLFGNDDRENVR